MNIFITLDYELFFGDESGSVDDCIIKPTEALLKIVDPYDIKITCFVDSGYLLALEKQKEDYDELKEDYRKVVGQIEYLSQNGHGIELHVHPHWEDSYYNGEKWVFNTERYKLSDFDDKNIFDIIKNYAEILKRITEKPLTAFRAGGWCAQPFSVIKKALVTNNIFIDSTVYPKGHHNSDNQVFDFTSVPEFITKYNFFENLTIPHQQGDFTEIPISSIKVLPSFFWHFAFIKTRRKLEHEAYGNGRALSMPRKEILRLLFNSSYTVVSIDGFKASLISKAFKRYKKNTNVNDNFVLIGHPKAFTPYSLQKVENFIKTVHNGHKFVTYTK